MRKAFTLLEFLIVLAIIVVLVCLFLPASENVRRAGSRIRCKQNLQQLGQACHTYRDTHGHFPPGTVPGTELLPEQRLSFHVLLLPFVEDDAGSKKFRLDTFWDAEQNRKALSESRSSPKFECAEWTGTTQGYEARKKFPLGPDSPALTTYVGIAGIGADALTRPANAPGVGMFGYDRTLKTEQVKDGLSNTLLLIETSSDVGPWVRGGPTTVRVIDPNAGELTCEGCPFGGTHIRDRSFFRGRVPDGFHVLLADGTVREVKTAISPEVLAALATIAGGEELPATW